MKKGKMKKIICGVLALCLIAGLCLGNGVTGKAMSVKGTQYTYKILVSKDKKSSYVQISNTKKKKIVEKVNGILKKDGTRIYKELLEYSNEYSNNIQVKYIEDKDLLVVTYSTIKGTGGTYPVAGCYFSVVDLSKGTRVLYDNTSLLKKINKAIKAGKFTCNAQETKVAKAQVENIKSNGLTIKSPNFTEKSGKSILPSEHTFMYETKTSYIITTEIIHALGDYTLITVKKKDL